MFDLIKTVQERIKKTRVTTQPLGTRSDLIQSVIHLSEKRRALTKVEANLNDEIAPILERAVISAEPLMLSISLLETLIIEFCQAHKTELLAEITDNEEGGKTLDLGVGKIRYRQNPSRVSFHPDEESALHELKEKGLFDCVRVTEEVQKEIVKARWATLAEIVKCIRIAQGKEKIIIDCAEVELKPEKK